MSKYGVFSGPYFSIFGLNMNIYSVNLHIQTENGKILSKKICVFRHFSHSDDVSVESNLQTTLRAEIFACRNFHLIFLGLAGPKTANFAEFILTMSKFESQRAT